MEIAGRYRLERRLGIGGMSTVHLALDTRLERHVAVKLLAEHLAEDSSFVSRFRREALAAARLVHPNVVQVFDSGFDEGSGRHFIVMEYVAGPSCAELLRDRGRLGAQETVEIVAQACRGLDYAHRNGVVHRDVKPGNLLRGEDGAVKLADFGIAKAAEQSSITQIGSVLGTAAYLAPEQARGEEAGPTADVYSLGVVAYQLLAGRLPYEAQSLTELALKQQRESPPRLDAVNSGVPPALAQAVARALAIAPSGRYPSARAMEEAFEAALRGVVPPPAPPGADEGATRVLPATGATEATRAMPARPAARPRPASPVAHPVPRPAGPVPTAPTRRRRRGRGAVGFLLVLALLGGGAAAAVLATSSSTDRVRLRDVGQDRVDQAVEALRSLIQDNTR